MRWKVGKVHDDGRSPTYDQLSHFYLDFTTEMPDSLFNAVDWGTCPKHVPDFQSRHARLHGNDGNRRSHRNSGVIPVSDLSLLYVQPGHVNVPVVMSRGDSQAV
jgi:hypothetical protein